LLAVIASEAKQSSLCFLDCFGALAMSLLLNVASGCASQ
jgi:hypothetical protein